MSFSIDPKRRRLALAVAIVGYSVFCALVGAGAYGVMALVWAVLR